MAVEVGKRFVDFDLQNQDGKTVTLGPGDAPALRAASTTSAMSTASVAPGSTALPRAPVDDQTITLYGPAGEDLMTIRSIAREGDELVVKGQAYGTMPLTAKLRPEQARRIFRMLGLSVFPLLFTFLFRRSKPRDAPSD